MNKVRFILSILLLPLLAVLIYNFIYFFIEFTSQTDARTAPFWIGVAVYCLFQIIFFKPMTTYVFGHELTHALTGILSGAKIKKFKVSKNGGSVTLTKDSILITLSPYFIPIYSLIICAVYLSLGFFIDIKQFEPYYLFISGVALSFHYALTFYALKIGQEDILVYGKFFSFVFIIFVNIIIFMLMIALIFQNNINIERFITEVLKDAADTYNYIFNGVYKCLAYLTTK